MWARNRLSNPAFRHDLPDSIDIYDNLCLCKQPEWLSPDWLEECSAATGPSKLVPCKLVPCTVALTHRAVSVARCRRGAAARLSGSGPAPAAARRVAGAAGGILGRAVLLRRPTPLVKQTPAGQEAETAASHPEAIHQVVGNMSAAGGAPAAASAQRGATQPLVGAVEHSPSVRHLASSVSIDNKSQRLCMCSTREEAAAAHDLALIWKRLHGKGGQAAAQVAEHYSRARGIALPLAEEPLHVLMQKASTRRQSSTFRSCWAIGS